MVCHRKNKSRAHRVNQETGTSSIAMGSQEALHTSRRIGLDVSLLSIADITLPKLEHGCHSRERTYHQMLPYLSYNTAVTSGNGLANIFHIFHQEETVILMTSLQGSKHINIEMCENTWCRIIWNVENALISIRMVQ